MADEIWDRRFLELAKHVSTWSKDPSTQVGAVIVDDLKHVVAMGFNGLPVGVYDTSERLYDRPTKLKFTVHAEINALLQAGERARGCTIYVYFPKYCVPTICHDCAKAAIQAGIRCVVGYAPDEHGCDPIWQESANLSREMFLESGVVWYQVGEGLAH